MIPIQCPKCGRTGNVPPDRLSSRLTCKGCQSAFHMDAGGRMVLGSPGDSTSKKAPRSRPPQPAAEFDLAQTWRDVPRPAKVGIPAVFVLLGGWMVLPSFSSGLAYQSQAEAVGRALLHGDRTQVVAAAVPASAEAAGKWFDLKHSTLNAQGSGAASAETISAALMSGDPETDSSLEVNVVVLGGQVSTNLNLRMVKDGGSWKFDATPALDEAERAAVPLKIAKKK